MNIKPHHLLNKQQLIVLWVGVIAAIIVVLFPPCHDWPKFVTYFSYYGGEKEYWGAVKPFLLVIMILTGAGLITFAEKAMKH